MTVHHDERNAWSTALPTLNVPLETWTIPAGVTSAVVETAPPLTQSPAVLGIRYGEVVMSAVNGVMVEALDTLNVPLTSVSPPDAIVITA